jgi:hypothetical protein
VTIGIAAAVQSGNFLMESKGYMVWSTILALVFSSLVHRVLSLLWQAPQAETGMIKESRQVHGDSSDGRRFTEKQ